MKKFTVEKKRGKRKKNKSKRRKFEAKENKRERGRSITMPTTAEIRERAITLGRRSMQQVREFGSRGVDYLQHRLHAFNDACRSRKNINSSQRWSTTTSERTSTSQNCKSLRENGRNALTSFSNISRGRNQD